MYERSCANVKVQPRLTSRLRATLHTLTLFYLHELKSRDSGNPPFIDLIAAMPFALAFLFVCCFRVTSRDYPACR